MLIRDQLIRIFLPTIAKIIRPIAPDMANRFRNSANRRATTGAPELGQPLSLRVDPTAQIDFLPYDPPEPIESDVKLIAHYLPQFHPFAENDAWWGKGFTEWSNVGKAVPNYVGQYQPHCPIHFGYYDLRVPEVLAEQAKVAKEYGIHGFSYYFYWFNGKVLMEQPLETMLGNPAIDMPFCLIWANESWSRRWSGNERDVLIPQEHSIADSVAFLSYIKKYMDDPRYIRIDARPVLIVYRAGQIDDLADTAQAWRKAAAELGLPGIYLIAAQTFETIDPAGVGFDAAMEFPPHQTQKSKITSELEILNPDFTGVVTDYAKAAQSSAIKPEPDHKLFRSVTLSWDNTARNQNGPRIMGNFTIAAYREWLSTLVGRVRHDDKYASDEKIVFINAWNEWAEGTHLEPDRRYGFAYLQATYDSLSEHEKSD